VLVATAPGPGSPEKGHLSRVEFTLS